MFPGAYKSLLTRTILLVGLGTALGVDVDPVVLGGTTVTNMNQAPWMALVVPKNTPTETKVEETNPPCGGVLIALNRVLTTAQCVTYKEVLAVKAISSAQIRVEKLNPNDPAANERPCDQDKKCVLAHPNYNPDTLARNIAIVYVQGTFAPQDPKITNALAAITWEKDATIDFTDKEVSIYGWGGDSGSATLAPQLRAAAVNVHSRDKCQSFWNCEGKDNVYQHMEDMCFGARDAAGTVNNIVPCGRDIGGPIVANYKPGGDVSKAVLVGLISFFKNSAEAACVPKNSNSTSGNVTTAAPVNATTVIAGNVTTVVVGNVTTVVAGNGTTAAPTSTTRAPTTTTRGASSAKTMFWNLLTSVLRSIIGANAGTENHRTQRMAVHQAYSARLGRQTIYTGNSCKTDTPAVGFRVARFATWITANAK